MKDLSISTKRYLLDLARRAIESQFKRIKSDYGDIPEQAKSKRGVFVTLTMREKLRGCIGNIEPEGPIYSAVARNAVLAAFDDPRFNVLSEEELPEISIEISILTEPKLSSFKDSEDLLDKLSSHPGVVLQKDWKKATFLPQVWDEIEDEDDFLNHLCAKAGLAPNTWRQAGDDLEVYFYDVIKFSEADI
jgi:hypothetical protein